MVKHIQTIRQQSPTNRLDEFDHFVDFKFLRVDALHSSGLI